jgi:hypothetical protein
MPPCEEDNMASFNIMALDRNFNLVALLRCTNLQWSRKYHESGTFSIQIPMGQYDPSFKYVYTNDRPETGKITQTNYIHNGKQEFIQLSGYFLENELNRMIVFAKGSGNVVNDHEWVEKSGIAEDVAYDFFDAFSHIEFNNGTDIMSFGLGISKKTNRHRGLTTQHVRDNSYLGNKIYHILNPSGMSYRVMYDFESNEKHFEVWAGKDRTSEQTENNPVIFSTKYGNIKNPSVLLDDSTYKSGCIVVSEKNNDEDSSTYIRVLADFDEFQEDNAFLFLQSSTDINDFENLDDYYQALDSEGRSEKNSKWTRTMNVDFESLTGSYKYMEDFDIGDVCSLEIGEVGVSADVRLIGCYEVVKGGNWSLTLEFGTPIIKR